ncbi:cytochrome C oxidase subunit IV family protein [Mycobacterium sp. CVI_P3]|uniref:Cytochrome C oxidase subunit IV family protein n=1 Tax=Mycobacterium pinniadriaticum TaxID=2994102 RepID=A0ABT3SA27_9MYCO|nr:cytochrome C oxidase subunit IV family protein [Mycobacterium pinniadriaticum]MCX2930007.1 cytochrome C oxidase subunit IV family protein [Mycobacterium pinniadriaticum]MCX2936344.1 cytochrome C oxidase subunit IV family protein [Mycobacterium pinniadriaticum]
MAATRRLTLVWIVLLALTFGSFLVGIEQSADLAGAAAITIIGIAMLKVRLIGLHFMDVRVAPTALRMLFEGYVLVVFAALVLLDVLMKP